MADIIQLRRDDAANWTSVNPTLASGELGYERDTNKTKIGDGVNNWNALPYTDSGGQVDSVVGGAVITVDSTDPVNPVVNFDDAPDDADTYGRVGGNWGAVTPQVDFTAHVSNHNNPHQTTLEDLSDTSVAGAVLRDVVEYNPTSSMWELSRRTRFIPDGYVSGAEYQRGDEVSNGSQISEAIVDGATEYPYVSPQGEKFSAYEGMMGTRQDNAKQILAGNRYILNEGGYLNGYKINTVAGNSYRVVLVEDPLGTPSFSTILEFTAPSTGWQELAVGPFLLYPDTTFDLFYLEAEPASTPVTETGNWNYATPNNANIPGTGVASQANKLLDELRINKTDNDGVDRSALLESLGVGDIISALGVEWVVQASVDNGNQMFFTVAPSSQATPDGVTEFTFETTVTTLITTPEDAGYWGANPPPNGTIQGLFGVDTAWGDIVPNDSAYGTDIVVQRAYVPTQWRIKVLSESGGGGGGGTGDVSGPATSQDNHLAVWNGTNGELLQDSTKDVDDVVTNTGTAVSANFAAFNGGSGKVIQDAGVGSSSFVSSSFLSTITSALQPNDDITELNNNAGYKAYYSGAALPDPSGYAEGDLFMVTS